MAIRPRLHEIMAKWLLKTEPDSYSWDDLVRDKKATWDGVSNATALIHIRSMKKGDLALIYHTGNQKQIVGVARVTSNAYRNPKEPDERLAVVDLKPQSKLKTPITLETIKSDPTFKQWELVRISRLGVMPVPDAIWNRLQKLSQA